MANQDIWGCNGEVITYNKHSYAFDVTEPLKTSTTITMDDLHLLVILDKDCCYGAIYRFIFSTQKLSDNEEKVWDNIILDINFMKDIYVLQFLSVCLKKCISVTL